jgi:hypothetical protein
MSYPSSLNDNRIVVEPYELIRVKTVTSIDMRIIALELFKSVTVSVAMYADDGYVCDNRVLEISGDEYLAWNNNDQYLVNLVCTKLGLTPVPASA